MLIAGAYLHAGADVEVAGKITVLNMAGTPGFMWIIAHGGTLLPAIKRLHRDIDVQDPRQPQRRSDGAESLSGQPVQSIGFADATPGHPHRVLTDRPPHSQQPGIDPVTADAVVVGIASVAAKHAQEHRAHDVFGPRCRSCRCRPGDSRAKIVPSGSRLKELEKENQGALAGGR